MKDYKDYLALTSATQLYLAQKKHRVARAFIPSQKYEVRGGSEKPLEIELCEVDRFGNDCRTCRRFFEEMKDRGWTDWRGDLGIPRSD